MEKIGEINCIPDLAAWKRHDEINLKKLKQT